MQGSQSFPRFTNIQRKYIIRSKIAGMSYRAISGQLNDAFPNLKPPEMTDKDFCDTFRNRCKQMVHRDDGWGFAYKIGLESAAVDPMIYVPLTDTTYQMIARQVLWFKLTNGAMNPTDSRLWLRLLKFFDKYDWQSAPMKNSIPKRDSNAFPAVTDDHKKFLVRKFLGKSPVQSIAKEYFDEFTDLKPQCMTEFELIDEFRKRLSDMEQRNDGWAFAIEIGRERLELDSLTTKVLKFGQVIWNDLDNHRDTKSIRRKVQILEVLGKASIINMKQFRRTRRSRRKS